MSVYTMDSLLEEIYDDLILNKNNKKVQDIYSFYESQDNPFINSSNKPMLSIITSNPEKRQSFLSKLFNKTKKTKPVEVHRPFKIKAIYSFCSYNNFLSFEKDQIFYVLKEDLSNGIYHVATSMKLPFSSTSVSGIVPKIYFQKIN